MDYDDDYLQPTQGGEALAEAVELHEPRAIVTRLVECLVCDRCDEPEALVEWVINGCGCAVCNTCAIPMQQGDEVKCIACRQPRPPQRPEGQDDVPWVARCPYLGDCLAFAEGLAAQWGVCDVFIPQRPAWCPPGALLGDAAALSRREEAQMERGGGKAGSGLGVTGGDEAGGRVTRASGTEEDTNEKNTTKESARSTESRKGTQKGKGRRNGKGGKRAMGERGRETTGSTRGTMGKKGEKGASGTKDKEKEAKSDAERRRGAGAVRGRRGGKSSRHSSGAPPPSLEVTPEVVSDGAPSVTVDVDAAVAQLLGSGMLGPKAQLQCRGDVTQPLVGVEPAGSDASCGVLFRVGRRRLPSFAALVKRVRWQPFAPPDVAYIYDVYVV